MIELTEQQRQAIEENPQFATPFVDPTTRRHFVLVRSEWFASLCQNGDLPGMTEIAQAMHYGIPLQLFRSMKSYWRELPGLLASWWKRGKWVAYWGDVRIAIARDQGKLIKTCTTEDYPIEQVYFGLVRPRDFPPWEPESMDGTLIEFDEEPPPPEEHDPNSSTAAN